MKHGSLFSGIGGWNIASDEMGWETVFNCEIDKFCQRVLKYYWPKAELYEDIKKTDFSKWRGKIDILTNSFPCQGFSVAGKRKGTEDNRYLWPESLRAIKEIQPTWVISENVHGIINIERGMVFEQVHTDLEVAGYEVFTYVLPACGVNAPHKRDRVWFVAHAIGSGTGSKSRETSDKRRRTNENRRKGIRQIHGEACTSRIDSTGGTSSDSSNTGIKGMRKGKNEVYESATSPDTTSIDKQRNGICKEQQERTTGRPSSGVNKSGIACNSKSKRLEGENRIGMDKTKQSAKSIIANADSSIGCEGGMHKAESKETERHSGTRNARDHQCQTWDNFPTQPPLCQRNDGISSKLDGITFPKWRNESIKGYGNAIVPQIVFQIFKAIESIHEKESNEDDSNSTNNSPIFFKGILPA